MNKTAPLVAIVSCDVPKCEQLGADELFVGQTEGIVLNDAIGKMIM